MTLKHASGRVTGTAMSTRGLRGSKPNCIVVDIHYVLHSVVFKLGTDNHSPDSCTASAWVVPGGVVFLLGVYYLTSVFCFSSRGFGPNFWPEPERRVGLTPGGNRRERATRRRTRKEVQMIIDSLIDEPDKKRRY